MLAAGERAAPAGRFVFFFACPLADSAACRQLIGSLGALSHDSDVTDRRQYTIPNVRSAGRSRTSLILGLVFVGNLPPCTPFIFSGYITSIRY
jgi:hypothetical protein